VRKPRPVESHTFAGMETAVSEQATAAAIQQAEELTAKMREPLADISARAGKLERESPLFYGTGDNPTLF
jgi:hypothetical protein